MTLDPTKVPSYMRYALCKNSILEKGHFRKQLKDIRDDRRHSAAADSRLNEQRAFSDHGVMTSHTAISGYRDSQIRHSSKERTTKRELRDLATERRIQEYCGRILDTKVMPRTRPRYLRCRTSSYPGHENQLQQQQQQQPDTAAAFNLQENPKLIYSSNHFNTFILRMGSTDKATTSTNFTTTATKVCPPLNNYTGVLHSASGRPGLPVLAYQQHRGRPLILPTNARSMAGTYRKLSSQRPMRRRFSLPHLPVESQSNTLKPELLAVDDTPSPPPPPPPPPPEVSEDTHVSEDYDLNTKLENLERELRRKQRRKNLKSQSEAAAAATVVKAGGSTKRHCSVRWADETVVYDV